MTIVEKKIDGAVHSCTRFCKSMWIDTKYLHENRQYLVCPCASRWEDERSMTCWNKVAAIALRILGLMVIGGGLAVGCTLLASLTIPGILLSLPAAVAIGLIGRQVLIIGENYSEGSWGTDSATSVIDQAKGLASAIGLAARTEISAAASELFTDSNSSQIPAIGHYWQLRSTWFDQIIRWINSRRA